jgi:hypothetical protein
MRISYACLALSLVFMPSATSAKDSRSASDADIDKQRTALDNNTRDKGFGPQAPRDLESKTGSNRIQFSMAPHYSKMNLCNIHFHKNAEHKGGQFTKFAGNGNGHGFDTGFIYNGTLTSMEARPLPDKMCKNKHGGLEIGDTIEVHYVYSTAEILPGVSLGACFNETNKNPQLRVEAQVFVLVNNNKSADFMKLMAVGTKNNYQQALNIPTNTGRPIQYAGSTTGPTYNEKGSPFQVTWSVRPQVIKVNAQSVGKWCDGNVFKENHAHGVRNLVKNPKLLSAI